MTRNFESVGFSWDARLESMTPTAAAQTSLIPRHFGSGDPLDDRKRESDQPEGAGYTSKDDDAVEPSRPAHRYAQLGMKEELGAEKPHADGRYCGSEER